MLADPNMKLSRLRLSSFFQLRVDFLCRKRVLPERALKTTKAVAKMKKLLVHTMPIEAVAILASEARVKKASVSVKAGE